MQTVLIPTGLGLNPDALYRHLKRMRNAGGVRVLLLSVQPRYNGHVRMYLGDPVVKSVIRQDAEREFAPWQGFLDLAGIPYTLHIETGLKAETIVKFAQRTRCKRIVLGGMPQHWLRRLIRDSLKSRLLKIANVLGIPLDLCDKVHPPLVQRQRPLGSVSTYRSIATQ